MAAAEADGETSGIHAVSRIPWPSYALHVEDKMVKNKETAMLRPGGRGIVRIRETSSASDDGRLQRKRRTTAPSSILEDAWY